MLKRLAPLAVAGTVGLLIASLLSGCGTSTSGTSTSGTSTSEIEASWTDEHEKEACAIGAAYVAYSRGKGEVVLSQAWSIKFVEAFNAAALSDDADVKTAGELGAMLITMGNFDQVETALGALLLACNIPF